MATVWVLQPTPLPAQPWPTTTSWGNPYQHRPERLASENGHRLHMHVCRVEWDQAWDQISDVPLSTLSQAGFPLSARLWRYLTSKGWPKDGAHPPAHPCRGSTHRSGPLPWWNVEASRRAWPPFAGNGKRGWKEATLWTLGVPTPRALGGWWARVGPSPVGRTWRRRCGNGASGGVRRDRHQTCRPTPAPRPQPAPHLGGHRGLGCHFAVAGVFGNTCGRPAL